MKDLRKQLMILNEASVKPGERKEISFKLKKLDSALSKLSDHQRSLEYLAVAASPSTIPDQLKNEMEAVKKKLNDELAKVQAAYDEVYKKSMSENNRPVKMENLFGALRKHCKQIIKVYKELNKNTFTNEKFLYRGIRSGSDALYGKPFTARKPKDSNSDLHDLVNGAINDLGFEANRENSTFVTGDRSQASGYGSSLYVIFPVDGFSFTWSKKEKDLVLDSGKRMQLIDSDVADKIRNIVRTTKNKEPDPLPQMVASDLFTDGYSYNRDCMKISKAIDEGILPTEVQGLLDKLLNTDSIQNYFNFTDQNVFEAIQSKKEIYLTGPYYAVNTNHITQLIDFLKEVDVDSVKLPENFGILPEVFEKGDIVRVKSGPFEGKLGVITYEYSNEYEVKFQQDMTDVTINGDDLELYKLPNGSFPKFDKDQKVLVTNPDSFLYGDLLTITTIFSNTKIDAEDQTGKIYSFVASELSDYSPELEKELADKPKPHKFAKGEYAIVSDPTNAHYNKIGKVTYLYSDGDVELTFNDKGEYVFKRIQLSLASEDDFNQSNASPDSPATTSDTDIKVGDNVKVINHESSYYGQVGEVIETGKTPDGKDWIKFKSPTLTGGVKTFIDWVEKVDDQPKFKEGDKVQINYSQSLYNGKEGTVSAGPDEDGDYKVAVGNKITYVPAGGMKKIDSTSASSVKFAIGDKVKIRWPGSLYDGREGFIEADLDNDGDYKIKLPNSTVTYAPPDKLIKIDDAKPSTSAFAVGDIVKALGPSAYNSSTYVGKNGTIASISDDGKFAGVAFSNDDILTYSVDNLEKITNISKGDKVKIINYNAPWSGWTGEVIGGPDQDGDYQVEFDNGQWSFYQIKDFEKVDDSQDVDKISIGDLVKITDSEVDYYGDVGTVISGPDSDNDYKVSFAPGTWAFYQPDHFEKVKEPASDENTGSTEEQQFKIHDVVQVIDPYSESKGKVGKIDFVYPSGKLGIEFDDGSGSIYDPKQLQPYSTDDVTDNLKWEPEPEPEAAIVPKFEINDRVEVVSQFPSLIGKKGTIKQVNSNYGVVSVQLDGNTTPSSFPSSALKKIELTDDLKIGDTVEVINSGLRSFGKTGEIVEIEGDQLAVAIANQNSPNDTGTVTHFFKKQSVSKIG